MNGCEVTVRRDQAGNPVACDKPVVWRRRKPIVVGKRLHGARVVVCWDACAGHQRDVQDNYHGLTTPRVR